MSAAAKTARTTLVAVAFLAVAISARSEPRLWFDPPLLELPVGGAQVVTVRAMDVPAPGLGGFQFELGFDPGVVAVEAVNGDPCFAPGTGWMLTSTGRTPLGTCDLGTPGRILVAYGSHGSAAAPQGSGVLATFRVRALAAGAARLESWPAILASTAMPATPYPIGREPLMLVAGAAGPDADGDGVPDAIDNCSAKKNGPLLPDAGGNVQLDRDGDGYGNTCDCDFDQSGTCTIADFNLFLPAFVSETDSGNGTDMNGDGTVGIGDFSFFLLGFASGVPGPSALAP